MALYSIRYSKLSLISLCLSDYRVHVRPTLEQMKFCCQMADMSQVHSVQVQVQVLSSKYKYEYKYHCTCTPK